MSQFNDTGYQTVALTETVGLFLRTDATGTLCGIAERGIGVACTAGVSGDAVSVALWSKAGTMKVVASAAISKDAIVYSAASGKVGATASTSYKLGIAIEAAGADGDIIEMMPLVGDTVVA
tara:strand:+ start:425 stop:787 length:363 start_codon:yes stop_codon:yes gene_type:complete